MQVFAIVSDYDWTVYVRVDGYWYQRTPGGFQTPVDDRSVACMVRFFRTEEIPFRVIML